MLEKNRGIYARAYKRLEEKGVFDDLAKNLHLEPLPKANGRARAAKKIGNKRVTAEKPKRRAVAARRVKLSVKK